MQKLRYAIVALGMAVLFSAGTLSQAAIVGQLGVLDDTANGGINPVTGSAWAPGDQYRLIFVSSTFRDAASGDVADYNAHVQAAANAAGLGAVNWNAIASTNVTQGGTATVDARDNTGTNPNAATGFGFFLMDGMTMVAESNADLWDGAIASAVNRTELNTAYAAPDGEPFAPVGVWTGTDQFGVNRGRAALGGTSADLGLSNSTTSQWTRRSEVNPNTGQLGFYAVSDVLTVVPEPTTAALTFFGLGAVVLRRRRSA